MAQDNPFLLGGTASGSKPKPNPFLLSQPGGGAKPKPNPFLLGGGSSGQSESLPVLEQTAEDVGAPAPAQDSPGLFRRAIDLINRADYASAGAAQEAFTPQGGGLSAVPGRVANELFSGIGSFKGKKEGFGQVLEEAGVPDYGHFSDLVPGLYNQTGQGLPLQKGGWADPTGRGAIGLGLDIALDPTTYLGFGVAGKTEKVGGEFLSKSGQKLLEEETAIAAGKYAKELGEGADQAAVREISIARGKERVGAAIAAGAPDLLDKGGIKFAGIHVADNPLSAIANSGVAKDMAASFAKTKPGQAVLSSTAWVKKNLVDTVGGLFVKAYGIRGLEGAKAIMDDHVNLDGYLKGLAYKDIAASPLGKWYDKSQKEIESVFRPVIDAYQAGGIAAVPEEFKPAMQYYADTAEKMYAEEVAAGLLQKENKLPNYYAHYYHNDVEDLADAIYAHRGGVYNVKGEVERMLNLGRNAEERAFDTLKDAETISARNKAAGKSYAALQGNYNPIDSLTRRWENSITKRVNRKMVEALDNKFGQLKLDAIYDLAQPVRYGEKAAHEKAAVDALLAGSQKTEDTIAALGKMSEDAKKDFFYRRFQAVGDRAEANNVLKAYESMEQFYPKRLINTATDRAADGSRFMEFNAGSFKGMLPESLGKEVAGMSDHVIRNPSLRKLLQGYDTVNNFWKGSVTWLFPSFHVRNAYSNVAQSFVDIGAHSLNPASYVETAQILFGKGEGTFKTALGNYSYDEVRDILNRHGINTSAAAKAEFTGNSQFFDKVGGAVGWARNAGTAIENESRAQLALNYLRRGMDPAEVGARVKKFQIDYGNGLTTFERQFMKRLVPFYAFQRLNLGLMAENLAKRPGMALAEVKPFLGRNSENEQMTSWDAGALKLRLNRDGKNVQMITGIDLPIRNLDLLFRGNIKDTMANAIGMLSPIVKTPIEVAANKSLFTGNEFQRVNSPVAGRIIEQMPVSMQKWMGYDKRPDAAGRPQYTFDAQRYYLIAQSFVTSRFLSTADRQWKQYLGTAQPNALSSLLDFTTGLRFQEMNMDEETAKRAKERQKDLEDALVRWGKRKEFQRVYVPK